MGKLDALWTYQQADMEIDKFEAQLRGSAAYKRYAKLHHYIEEQRRVLQRMSDAVEDRKRQIALTSQRFELLKQRQDDGALKFEAVDKSDLAEIERFREYFEQLHQRLAQERREFAGLVTTLEKEDSQLSDMRVRLGKARKEYDDLKVQIDAERAAHTDEVAALKAQADALAQKVDPDLLERYKTTKRSHPMAVANLDGNKCGGCNVELPAVILRKIKEDADVVECDNCGRMLRLAE